MKKFCLIFIFLLCVFNGFAQKNNVVEQIQKGDLTLLDAEIRISDFELAQMDNTELRLLRNMIYAKYGHSFNSKDLIKFFSQFDWYVPVKKVDDSEFTEKEQWLIKRIKTFESRNENLVAAKFGDEIIGLWHASPIMPDTWGDRFLIYPDNRIEFLISYFIKDSEIKEYLGNYEIKGNVLIFNINKTVGKEYIETLTSPLILKYPITNVTEVSFFDGTLIRQMLKIGSYEYFLYSNNVNTMGDWARKY